MRSLRTTNKRRKNRWRKAVRREWRQACDELLAYSKRVTDSIDSYSRLMSNIRIPHIFPGTELRFVGKHPALGTPSDPTRYRK